MRPDETTELVRQNGERAIQIMTICWSTSDARERTDLTLAAGMSLPSEDGVAFMVATIADKCYEMARDAGVGNEPGAHLAALRVLARAVDSPGDPVD